MQQRHTKILELLSEYKRIEVTKLSELLGVSQVTIRKDLDILEESGILVREHGYAALNANDDINNRLAYQYTTKQEIARMATEMVADGETIMIESGSCCALLALSIVTTRKNITLITNSAFIADYVRKKENAKIIVLGGEYQNRSQVMVGPLTKKTAEAFFVDKLFIGVDGFSTTSGFTGNDYMRGEAVRDMAMQADKVMVVTDSGKFSHKGVVKLMDTNQVHSVFTDSGIPIEMQKYLQEKGVQVHTIASS